MALDESRIASIRVARQQELIESLSAMRLEEKSDVCLVCQETQFFVHKIVLQSASPYFATMFNTQLEESKSGRVVFDQMDPDSLDCILDFIYLATVEKIKTEKQLKEILKASHLMQLDKLVQYCCDVLTDMLSVENVFELLHLSEIYFLKKMQIKVRQLWISQASTLTTTDNFLSLSVDGVKELLNCFQSQPFCLDGTLAGVLKWLSHDVNLREKFASELLNLFDGNFLSKDFMKGLIAIRLIMPTSIITTEVMKLAAVVLRSENNVSMLKSLTAATNLLWDTVLTFVSGHYNVEVFDPSSDSEEVPLVTSRSEEGNCIQQFNLADMTWMPLMKYISFELKNLKVLYQHKSYIHFSYCVLDRDNYVMDRKSCIYDMQTNKCNVTKYLRGSYSPCHFKERIVIIDGCNVRCMNPLGLELHKVHELSVSVVSTFVLASHHFIYVIGSNYNFKNELVIQYCSNLIEDEEWEVIRFLSKGLNSNQFFVYNDTLNALYFGDTKCKHLSFNHDNKKWRIEGKFEWPDTSEQNLVLSKFQNSRCPFIFFSEIGDCYGIPCFTWDPESGVWSKLPPPKGKCEFPNTSVVGMVYYLES